ncbi:glycerophosphodiester phosphodiesterase [Luteolibacter yonseiensis]|uniref:Glycerophosphodiester phosphodiesterase n=1 Tax=Luteolibacter yonseiensis TaxID=1144680 RepID=A0A934R144_9BACT|nr:glycerophosphodiester phosphodiesterase [Luteolibacter yonseiensis]MBK1814562.1 glycerophosphodiester phosphodiesterase [Luteolibacter yonseiensis]
MTVRKLLPLALFLCATPLFAGPFLVAHRGASKDAPENTIPAFELAWKQGADAIEGDFHLTADGKIVCIHDYDTLRVSGTKKSVKQSTLQELQELDAGAWFQPQWKGVRLPTFSEVAATVPAGKKFYIEVKCGPEIVPELLRGIEASGLKTDQIVIISFHAPVIREMKEKASQFKAYWLSSFEKSSPLEPSLDDVLTTLRAIKADGFSSQADARLTAEFIKGIRDAGFEYHSWTIDEPKVAENFLNLGAQSITTNRPAFLREALEHN